MAMTRTSTAFTCVLALALFGCGEDARPQSVEVDCSVLDGYEFLNIFDFTGTQSGWFWFGDPTPSGVNAPQPPATDLVVDVDPARCGDARSLKLQAYGHNFWGAGFGDWTHNSAASRAPDGSAYEGISFWVRSAPNRDQSFLLDIYDGRTFVWQPTSPTDMTAYEDVNDDGILGPGDIVAGSSCQLPPPQELGDPSCYNGGVNAPASATRVPSANECGNSFHTVINMTTEWQLVLLPWRQLVQWPCPNRLAGGIDPTDIAKFEIKLEQGTHYEFWIDNIQFYRRRSADN